MRRIWLTVVATLATGPILSAQTTPPPQSARQALIEMFMSKNMDDFAKHLPEVSRQALIHKGETPETSVVLRFATFGRGAVAQGERVETFDIGPNLLVSEQQNHERFEVAVEHDNLMGDQDEIELAVHYYKDGQEQFIPVVPRLTFTLQQEKDIWRLTDITLQGRVPLTDPEYLKGARKQLNEENERMTEMQMNQVVAAQAGYASAHPEIGFTCKLADVMPMNAQSAPADTTAPSDPGQGNQEWYGYRFTLSGCKDAPSTKYRLTAVPIDPDPEGKTYCADESGKVKFMTGGKPSSCFSGGQLANPEPPPTPAVETD